MKNRHMEHINMNMAHYRHSSKISQTTLAQKLFLDQTTISKYEKGLISPPIELLPKIAEILHCSIEELVLALIETKQTYTSKLNKKSKLGG